MVKFDEEIVCMKIAVSINEAGYGAVIRDARVGIIDDGGRTTSLKNLTRL